MNELKNELYKRLAFIAMAAVVLLAIGSNKGPLRFVAAAAVLFAAYHLMVLIFMSPAFLATFIPVKHSPNPKNLNRNKIIYQSGGWAFLLGLIAFIIQDRAIENTVNGLRFFFTWAAAAEAIFVLLIALLKRLAADVFYDNNARFTIYMSYFIGLALMAPAVASFVNQHWAAQAITCKTYYNATKTEGSKGTRFLFVNVNGGQERFLIYDAIYNQLKDTGAVQLCIRHGALRYDFVEQFKAVQDPF